jgi:putative transposase
MGRSRRVTAGGMVYHVLNRANGRQCIFGDDGDYAAFEKVIAEAVERSGMRLLAYIVMPNHWHMVVWPKNDGDLSRFVGWLTLTHTQRWHAFRDSAGFGHLYQGRFKSIPVQEDQHLRVVCRYVERNALRAGLVRRARDWRWCSLWRRESGDVNLQRILSEWPTPAGGDWLEYVNEARTEAERDAVRACIARGRPFGGEAWQARTARRLGLEASLVPLGRPKKTMSEKRVPGTVMSDC